MADLEESTFRAVGKSDEKMYGTPAVVLAGANEMEQFAVRELMNVNGLGEIPVIVVTRRTIETTLNDLAQLPDGTGFGVEEKLPRAIVMSGLTEAQFHTMMDSYRKLGLPRPIWASVTPTSGSWTIKALLIELLNENRALREATQKAAEKREREG
jgi:hypothetical protein